MKKGQSQRLRSLVLTLTKIKVLPLILTLGSSGGVGDLSSCSFLFAGTLIIISLLRIGTLLDVVVTLWQLDRSGLGRVRLEWGVGRSRKLIDVGLLVFCVDGCLYRLIV